MGRRRIRGLVAPENEGKLSYFSKNQSKESNRMAAARGNAGQRRVRHPGPLILQSGIRAVDAGVQVVEDFLRLFSGLIALMSGIMLAGRSRRGPFIFDLFGRRLVR
jgi:hypothetical protein